VKVDSGRFFAVVVLACGLAWGQQPGNSSPDAPAYESGSIANNIYTNECLGFSLAIPDGWQVNTQFVGADGKARHTTKGTLILLMIGQQKEGSSANRVALQATDASVYAPTVQEFISNNAHGQVNLDREHREMLKDTYSVDYGGKPFSRADYKQTMSQGTMYIAFVYTKFRGYYIGETVIAGSPEGLEQSANSLQHISFREGEPNSKCVMHGDDSSNSGVISGVISSKPPLSNSPLQGRVRISQGVSIGLLLKKVSPHYPDDARQARIQGQVVVQVLIDKNGDVEKATLVSGHPSLAPAALEAVKQWKYKPYLLNNQPMAVETQVVINFSLAGS